MLREMQRAFRAGVLGGDPAAAEAFVVADRISAADRVLVYRNNAQRSLVAVLASDFPVTQRVVGPDFFREMARQFIFAHPPTRPELLAYGSAFPDFIAGFPPARGLAYLADVARLEAAIKQSYFAADTDPLDPAALADVAPDAIGRLVLHPHPGIRIVASPHPILTIHRMNQPENRSVGRLDPAAPGETVLVSRSTDGVATAAIAAADAAFLLASAQGQPLADALARAAAADPRFDLQAFLTEHLPRGTFAGATVA